ncbi:metallophosphoesterase [Nocardioides sp. GY 10113]|uniref:metallophosphoesterase family protein n=1 Tax=Nocardioides sp. GY 10113 TaxID=2569761 RepID=UPI0010A8F796|nr:metallophosphoesterase [Nocardioides sp. GY 10113]TIC87588.1 metallophosphoesterase [Nocardioides sp. GY 10113]
MVRVLAIADEEAPDLHAGALRDLAPDLVLSAGDLNWDYVEYVASAVDAPVAFVPGNHEPAIPRVKQTRNGTYVCDGIVCDAPRPHGAVNADRSVLEIAGLRIAGLGGCVRYREGPHQYTQQQYRRLARRLARRARRAGPVDVLLTHAPPFGMGDGDDRPHEGIEALRDAIEILQPTWHLHGHIHPYGHPKPDRQLGGTTIRNVIPWRMLEITPRALAPRDAAGRMV